MAFVTVRTNSPRSMVACACFADLRALRHVRAEEDATRRNGGDIQALSDARPALLPA